MGYSYEEISYIFNKTNGYCRFCKKQLAFSNYGKRNARGGWEVEHSNPRANGGTDHGRNLYAACWSCNLKKLDTAGHHFNKKFEHKTMGGYLSNALGLPDGFLGSDPRRVYRG